MIRRWAVSSPTGAASAPARLFRVEKPDRPAQRPGASAAGAVAEETWAHPFDPRWCVVAATGGDMEPVTESRLCLADGTVGTRGVLEQEDDPDIPPVTAADLYEPDGGSGERLMALPSWCTLPLVGGMPIGRRVLDLRDGMLTREVVAGDSTLLTGRFACIAAAGHRGAGGRDRSAAAGGSRAGRRAGHVDVPQRAAFDIRRGCDRDRLHHVVGKASEPRVAGSTWSGSWSIWFPPHGRPCDRERRNC